jgi:hypothetical protein
MTQSQHPQKVDTAQNKVQKALTNAWKMARMKTNEDKKRYSQKHDRRE